MTRVTPNPDALAPDDVLRGLKWGIDREDQRRLTHDWMRLHDENERLREAIRAHRDDPLAWDGDHGGAVDDAAHRDLANEKLWSVLEPSKHQRVPVTRSEGTE